MKIVCDRNMPYAVEAFSTLGEVVALDGRAISPEDVKEADILLTRSTTRVNEALLRNSSLRFYGSSVIGTDHIDIPYLKARGVPWCSAPGCNAESVANYMTAALLWLGGRYSFSLRGKTAGVIGVGNVGKRVVRHLRALGIRVLACDPPRQEDPDDREAGKFFPLSTLLKEADIITCHVPMTRQGKHATFHMLGAPEFAAMKPGTLFINAARGAILESGSLISAIDSGRISHAVIDCWEGEPAYRRELLHRVDLATPHIAGHAFEGKVNGTRMVYEAACRFLGVPATFPFTLPPPPHPFWEADAGGREEEDLLREAVLTVYDIEGDSRRFRTTDDPDPAVRAKNFDFQRSHYPLRRQFDATAVKLHGGSAPLLNCFSGLGFRID